MKVKLLNVTPNAEEFVVEIARVSSTRNNKKAEGERLINYLIKHKHWSPFEHSYMTVEINTSKAIGIQLLRHRSFTFQELSQRYVNPEEVFGNNLYEPIELRKQAETNRQSSTDVFNDDIYCPFENLMDNSEDVIHYYLDKTKELYSNLLEAGVAKECARMILPMTTGTKIYMTGNLRSWIHFLAIRDDEHAQKEIQEIAKAIKEIFIEEFPIISKALGYVDTGS